MANPNVNVISSPNIQVTDLLNPASIPVVSRQNISVIFPAVTAIYDGFFQAVNSPAVNILDGVSNYGVIYVRHAGNSGTLQLLFQTPGNLINFFVTPGGFFFTAMPSATPLNIYTGLFVSIAAPVSSGVVVPVEYLLAK